MGEDCKIYTFGVREVWEKIVRALGLYELQLCCSLCAFSNSLALSLMKFTLPYPKKKFQGAT